MGVDVVTDELVDAARAGDVAALNTLYRGLAPAVHGYLCSKGVEDADGATSEVFLSLFDRLPRVRGGATGLRKLTFSIAHARMVDEHRARKRRPIGVDWSVDTDPRQVPSAEHQAELNDGTRRVMRMLDRLPADQREVLVLRIVADLAVDQIADIMGRSSGAVKQLQRRGMVTLRAIVEAQGVTL
ncbi:MAG TPA: RNA polymerase sigma factor [Jatrophihabitans sp.]|jgi:RNA polymerase sigma-70 factor (ECF subfamily)